MGEMRQSPSRWQTMSIGALTAAMGLGIVLISLEVIPAGKANAPMWVVTLAGLCFLLGGLAILIPAAVTGEARRDGEIPVGAPQWLRVLQYLFGLALFACFASIGSWIAFGPGARSFGINLPFLSTVEGSDMLGRIAFGIGALIAWLGLIGFTVHGWRKLVRKA
jgi:hypothetical protein